ncbi:type 1 fimbrial protein [Burkholderia sp. JSH-S8]|nr:type 1 fimbrial protein [Burkholderia sp. JSH-S8]
MRALDFPRKRNFLSFDMSGTFHLSVQWRLLVLSLWLGLSCVCGKDAHGQIVRGCTTVSSLDPLTAWFVPLRKLARDAPIGMPVSNELSFRFSLVCPAGGHQIFIRPQLGTGASADIPGVWTLYDGGTPTGYGIKIKLTSSITGWAGGDITNVFTGYFQSNGSAVGDFTISAALVKVSNVINTYSNPAQNRRNQMTQVTPAILIETLSQTGLAGKSAQVNFATVGLAMSDPFQNGDTCIIDNPAIELGRLNVGQLPNVGAAGPWISSYVSLMCPGNGPAMSDVYITLTDANNTSNRTEYLTLAGGQSAAQGVGIQIQWESAANMVKFGPESSIAGNPGQFRIGFNTGSRNYQIKARYVRTGSLRPGAANARALMTLSYQ